MLNSANRRKEVARLSRILTIKPKSLHMFQQALCLAVVKIKLQGGKDLSQVS